MMIIHAAKPLFAWDCLEDSPSLRTIKDLLASLPDGKLLNSLRNARGKGCNDYSVSVLWGVVVLRIALWHITTEAVLAELRRNEGLRRILGIESESGVPKPWNICKRSRLPGAWRRNAGARILRQPRTLTNASSRRRTRPACRLAGLCSFSQQRPSSPHMHAVVLRAHEVLAAARRLRQHRPAVRQFDWRRLARC